MRAYIHTSDRLTFRRCRRKWAWSSRLGNFLEPTQTSEPLWTGTGVHFALEDFHGYNRYGNPANAINAYVEAYRKSAKVLPDNWQDEQILACGMMNHYTNYLKNRDPLKTFWYNDRPQVEVMFEFQIPDFPIPEGSPYTEVWYRGTFDRVIIDEYERLWIVEYKTAKRIEHKHYATDQQITSYCWAGKVIYPDMPIQGVIYQQHKKVIPEEPALLAKGTISTNKQQSTTWYLYYKALENLYGKVEKAPAGNIDCLNYLAGLETEHSDNYVIREWVERNDQQLKSEGLKLMLELEDILNPNLPKYPNPTRDCSWDCSFVDPCIALDSGDDWETQLNDYYVNRKEDSTQWRQYLP